MVVRIVWYQCKSRSKPTSSESLDLYHKTTEERGKNELLKNNTFYLNIMWGEIIS